MPKLPVPLRPTLFALALLGLAAPAHAQYPEHVSCAAEAEFDIDNKMPHGKVNGCMRALSEQRAAILLPSAHAEIERVPADHSLRRHAWGFVDQNGQLAVTPRFEEVRDFRNGRAAVKQRGKWGFIDPRGRTVVPARYDAVEDYVSVGLALVTEGNTRRLIDRRGLPVGEAYGGDIKELKIGEGTPALAWMIYHETLHRDDGMQRYADVTLQLHKALSEERYIGSNELGLYGLLDADLNWVLEPAYHDISTIRDAPMALGVGEEEVVLIDQTGKLHGEGRGYVQIDRLGDMFWLAKLARKGYVVLDDTGAERLTLDSRQADGAKLHGLALFYTQGKSLMAFVPGLPQPLTLGASDVLQPSDETEGYVLVHDTEHDRYGVLTPNGAWIYGDDAPAALTALRQIKVHQGRLWLQGEHGRLLDILDADGKSLFTAEQRDALENLAIRPLGWRDANAPIGISRDTHCQCGNVPTLMLADGTLIGMDSWTDLIPLDASDDERPEGEPAPAPESLRFAAQTAQGMVLLDARGEPVGLPPQKHIGAFRHGYAFVYQDDKVQLIDRAGKPHALPEHFSLEPIGNGLARYVQGAAEGEPWGLYDIEHGTVVLPPQFAAIESFHGDLAIASLGAGRTGVIDTQGRWRIPPEHGDVRRMTDAVWLVQQAADTPVAPDETPTPIRRLVNAEGKVLVDWQPGLDTYGPDEDGMTAAAGDKRWLVSVDGTAAVAQDNAYHLRVGRWTQISRDPLSGYLDAQGQWQFRTPGMAGTPFRGEPARAVMPAAYSNDPVLIDADGNTVAELPEGDWSLSPDGKWLVSQAIEDTTVTRYADLTGKILHTVPGYGDAPSEGVAVVQGDKGKASVVALTPGTPVPPAAYRYLGARHDGLALANAGDRLGYLDARGAFTIAPAYLAASPFSGQRAVVSTDSDSMLIDTHGKVLARVGMECGMRVLYGETGARLWPKTLPDYCQP
ncbi:WG repeat-containing protein [Pseudomonadota bacterium AL_CKDN230030165-1A_HGKHYDSX7]